MAHGNNYDAARWSLMPNPEGASKFEATKPAACSSPPDDGTFDPAPTFAGGRPGWVFKLGEYGSGYYLDVAQLRMRVAVPKQG